MNNALGRGAWALALCLLAVPLWANTRLSAGRIRLGQSVVLHLETGDSEAPDVSPLQADFEIQGVSQRSEVRASRAGVQRQRYVDIRLKPRRAGVLAIPVLRAGSWHSRAMQVVVEDAVAPVPDAAPPLADTFVEVALDDDAPHAQQSVAMRVRLYHSQPFFRGSLPPPQIDGAHVKVAAATETFEAVRQGTRYRVHEQRYWLIPEQAGSLALPALRFTGEGWNGLVSAQSLPRQLTVAPIPDAAPEPWLPAQSLTAGWEAAPVASASLTAGEAFAVTVRVQGEGVRSVQLPSPVLRASGEARIFTGKTEKQDVWGEPPVAEVVQHFSIVPAQPGQLELHLAPLYWWDTRQHRVREVTLPPLRWQVLPGAPPVQGDAAQAVTAATAPADEGEAGAAARAIPPASLWPPRRLLAAVAAALVLLAALAYGWPRWRKRARSQAPAAIPPAAALAEALARADAQAFVRLLPQLAPHPAATLEAAVAQLADATQREAVQALEAARWGQGDPVAAWQAVRHAFAHGARWQVAANAAPGLLPPLYPRH